MAPKMKLIYFDGRGRAEFIRLILAAGEIPYEDVRLKFEQWTKLKPSTTFGSVPVLEYDDEEEIAQSLTIARFVAKKAGLAGRNELEQAQADMIVDHCNDAMTKLFGITFSTGDKSALIKEFLEKYLPSFLRTSENLLRRRGGKHIAGNQLTYGDIALFHTIDCVTDPKTELFQGEPGSDSRFRIMEKYPLLKDLTERVRQEPGIYRWLKIRP